MTSVTQGSGPAELEGWVTPSVPTARQQARGGELNSAWISPITCDSVWTADDWASAVSFAVQREGRENLFFFQANYTGYGKRITGSIIKACGLTILFHMFI